MNASSPTARIVLPSSATACATGSAGFSVQTLPLTRIRLASLACVAAQQKISANKRSAIRRRFILFVELDRFVFAHEARCVLLSLGFPGFGARFAASDAGVALSFPEALDEADWRAGEIPFFANLIFEEALVAEVERIFLVGEEQECRRRSFRLDEIVDFDGASFWRRAALEIDFFLEPAIEFGRRDALAARCGDLVDQRIEFRGAVAGFCGKKNDWRVAEKFQFVAHEFFVVEEQAALVLIAETVDALGCAGVRIFAFA